MKTHLIIIFLSIFSMTVSAQNDSQAKSILDKVSAKNSSLKTIKADFKYTITNMQTQETSKTETGKIQLKNNKYHLQFSTTDILSDGKDIYTYLKASNEINITKTETSKKSDESFFLSNPKGIFSAYKDFKTKLIKETTIGNSLCYEIDLYPINLKTTTYSRIRMHIEKTNLQIVDIKLIQKDGTQILLELSDFKGNTEIADAEFVFDRKKYPKAIVNDLRF